MLISNNNKVTFLGFEDVQAAWLHLFVLYINILSCIF